MLNFNKLFNVKIISIFISMILLCNASAYGIDLSNNRYSQLRVPLLAKEAGRVEETLTRIGRSGRKTLTLEGELKRFDKLKRKLKRAVAIGLSATVLLGIIYFGGKTIYDRADHFSYNLNEIQYDIEHRSDSLVLQYEISFEQCIALLDETSDKIKAFERGEIHEDDVVIHLQYLIDKLEEEMSFYYGLNLDWVPVDKRETFIKSILDFFENIHMLDQPSSVAGIKTYRLKNLLISALYNAHDDAMGFSVFRETIERLKKLYPYYRSMAAKKMVPSGKKYFPWIDEELYHYVLFESNLRSHLSRLKERAKVLSGDDLDLLPDDFDGVDKWLDAGEAGAYAQFLKFFGSIDEIDKELRELREMQETERHVIPLRLAESVKEIRRLPPEVVAAIKKSSLRHNIPEHILVYDVIKGTTLFNRNYSIRRGLRTLGRRLGASGETMKDVAGSLPDFTGDIRIGSKESAFVGAMLGGKATIGMCRIRPVWVRRYAGEAWKKEFGADVEELSDQEISWLLLDPAYSIEASAAIWRGAIDWIKEVKRIAIEEGKVPDLSLFEKEATEMGHFFSNYTGLEDSFILLPLILSLPNFEDFNNNDWVVTIFHPQFEWFVGHSFGVIDRTPNSYTATMILRHLKVFYLQKLIVMSGVLDDKAASFSEINTRDGIGKLKELLDSEDGYMRDAAIETLNLLSKDQNEEIKNRALELLLELEQSKDTGQSPLKSELPAKTIRFDL